jgi:hypothetical protein
MQICGAILLVTLLASQAGAVCNVPRPRLICAEYFQSKAVVIARLNGVSPVKDDYDDLTGTYYSVTVEQLLRGQVARTFRVYVANNSARTTFDWTAGSSYVLFLHRQTENGSWVIDGCGNSGPSSSKQSALDQIDMLDRTANRARIQGAVGGVSYAFPSAGVRIEASGSDGVVTGETDAVGKFEMNVAPGKYQVRAESPGKRFVADEFTYEHPENLVLETGSCAQIQFVESNKK